jgi:hypothetical protein
MNTSLTTADLDQMTSDDRWLGFGYLGERRNLRTYAIEETNGRRQLELMTQATRMDRDASSYRPTAARVASLRRHGA